MKVEDIDIETLTSLLNDYIKEEYDYDYADVFGDEIDIHTYDGNVITITVNVEIDKEGDE